MRSFFLDVTIGVLACAMVYFLEIPFAVSKSIFPWLIGPAVFLVTGFVRGCGKGNPWVKAMRINLGNWCFMFWFTSNDRFPSASDWRDALPWMLTTFASVACGIAARRLWIRATS
jgi:hypothetical protein